MSNQQQQQPLWEVMHNAASNAPLRRGADSTLLSTCEAARLRAIADRVAPARMFPDGEDNVQKGIWLAHTRIRQLLLDEADRAEAGE